MQRLRIWKIKEKSLVWIKFRYYIDVIILVCCLIIAFNIHPSSIAENNLNNINNKIKIKYIFHDYEWNEYIMNEDTHWASSSWDYLFDDEIPNDLKWDDKIYTDSVSIWDLINKENQDNSVSSREWNNNWNTIKDNQVSINDIMSDLWVNSNNKGSNDENSDNDKLVINIWTYTDDENNRYTVENDEENNTLIIERKDNKPINWENEESNNEESKDKENSLLIAKTFSFVDEGRVLPSLISWNDLYFWEKNQTIAYAYIGDWDTYKNNTNTQSWITIIDDYADCMTPWWYKIHHWESVLAYKQMDDTPDLCHIERRFCRKGKLSWTYTQQWCSINEDYSYEERWNIKAVQKVDDWFNWKNTRQNPDGSVSVKNNEIKWDSWLSDSIPNKTSSSYSNNGNNIREEDEWVSQTSRVYRNCTAPRWEKIKHWDFIQAFKHANWFSDAPCEMQIRLCTMWELMWTFTEARCKTWNTSFIDWVNGSPSRGTYSKEKIELVKKQIKNRQKYYEDTRKNAERSTDSEALDKILYILDQD